MIFLPLLCYGFYRIFTEDMEKRSTAIPGCCRYWASSGIIQSHVLSCEIAVCLPSFVLIMYPKSIPQRTFLELVKVVVGTVLANIWFLSSDVRYDAGGSILVIPITAAYTFRIGEFGGTDIFHHAECRKQFQISGAGNGGHRAYL